MGYVDSLLGQDEHIIYVGRKHVFLLITRLLSECVVLSLLIVSGIVAFNAFGNRELGGMPANLVALGVCIGGGLMVIVSGVSDFLAWSSDTQVVTDRRLIRVSGIINKTVLEPSLEHITDIQLRQSWFGRMLNYGTIEIDTASDDAPDIMAYLAAPIEFKKALQDAKYNYERGFGYLEAPEGMPPQPEEPPRTSPTVTQPIQLRNGDMRRALEELASLRDRGILSDEEFESKKRELLSRVTP